MITFWVRITARQVHSGECLPRGYGIAWQDFHSNSWIAFPIPFNWIFRLARDIYWHLQMGLGDRELQEYKAGVNAGIKIGEQIILSRLFPKWTDEQREQYLRKGYRKC